MRYYDGCKFGKNDGAIDAADCCFKRPGEIAKGVATILLGLCLSAAFCQAPPEPNPGPVQAELIAPLNVSRLERGAIIFARVTLDWKGLGCTLRTGSTLEGLGRGCRSDAKAHSESAGGPGLHESAVRRPRLEADEPAAGSRSPATTELGKCAQCSPQHAVDLRE